VKAIDDWYGYGPNVPIVNEHVKTGFPTFFFPFAAS
jgi:hypothetical protein